MATDLTIHDLDDKLVDRLREEARRRGVSFDRFIAQSLQRQLPIQPTEPADNGAYVRDVGDLIGVWTKEDAREFFAAISDLEQVDEELWK